MNREFSKKTISTIYAWNTLSLVMVSSEFQGYTGMVGIYDSILLSK